MTSRSARSTGASAKRDEPSRRPVAKPDRTEHRLPAATARLLSALAEPGALAAADPGQDEAVLVSGSRRGVSLGRGAHTRSALAVLLERGLVERDAKAPAERYRVSDAGRAHLRRREAGPADGFGAQHRDMHVADIAGEDGLERVALNAAESPLAWLRRRRDRDGEPLIDAASFEAGERLRRDLTIAGLLPGVTARWDGAIGGGGAAIRDPASAADAVIAARQRARAALAAVGQDLADLLLDLCGFLKGLELIELERGWPQRSAKVVVRLALRQLARHYGYECEAQGPARSRGIRRWTADLETAA